MLRFRIDLRLHYTTENACHMHVHAGTTIEMYSDIPYYLQTRFQKSWDTVQIVNKKGMQ